MPTFSQNFAGVTDGTVPTTTNLTSGGTNAVSVQTATGDYMEIDSFKQYAGRNSLALNVAAAGTGATRVQWAQAEPGRYVLGALFQITDVPASVEDVMGIRNATGQMGSVVAGSDGKLLMFNSAGAGLSASRATNPLPVETWVDVQIAVKQGTSTTDGTLGFAYFLNGSGTPTYSWESTVQDAGITDVARAFVGRTTGRTDARTMWFAAVRGATLASGWLPPVPNTVPAQLTLTGDGGGIEPGDIVTITALVNDPGATVASVALAQTAGTPAVTLTRLSGTSWSYPAPATNAGTTLTFQATASLTGGGTVTSPAMPHTIFRATEFVKRAGIWEPVFFSRIIK